MSDLPIQGLRKRLSGTEIITLIEHQRAIYQEGSMKNCVLSELCRCENNQDCCIYRQRMRDEEERMVQLGIFKEMIVPTSVYDLSFDDLALLQSPCVLDIFFDVRRNREAKNRKERMEDIDPVLNKDCDAYISSHTVEYREKMAELVEQYKHAE